MDAVLAQLHLKDWWWLLDVFGLAQVLSLAAVGVALYQLARELRTTVRVVVKTDRKAGTAEITFQNKALVDAPVIRKVWAVPKADARTHHEAPSDAHDADQRAYFKADTPLGTIAVPQGPFVVIAQTQSNARFYSDVV